MSGDGFLRGTQSPAKIRIWYEKAFKSKLSGNEVYHTIFLISLVCSKLHCQKFFNLKACSYQIRIFAGDCVPRKKPSPDIYNLARETFAARPEVETQNTSSGRVLIIRYHQFQMRNCQDLI